MLAGSPVSLCSGLGLTQRERGWLLHLEARILSYGVGHNFLKLPISYLPGVTGISGPAQIKKPSIFLWGFPGGTVGKESACQCRRHRFNPWVGKIPWRRKWQPTPVFLHGKFHGQRSLVGYSPWGCKESDTTEHTCTISLWVMVQDV